MFPGRLSQFLTSIIDSENKKCPTFVVSPLHYIKIRDPEKGLSSRINLDLNNNNLVNLDKFKSTYKSGQSKIVDVWFQIYLNFFSKK